jgi:hypothetical protein
MERGFGIQSHPRGVYEEVRDFGFRKWDFGFRNHLRVKGIKEFIQNKSPMRRAFVVSFGKKGRDLCPFQS